MKCRHQKIYILERQVKIPADKGISAHTVIQVNALPYSMIRFQKIVDASFCPYIQDNGNEDVVQRLGCRVGNP